MWKNVAKCAKNCLTDKVFMTARRSVNTFYSIVNLSYLSKQDVFHCVFLLFVYRLFYKYVRTYYLTYIGAIYFQL